MFCCVVLQIAGISLVRLAQLEHKGLYQQLYPISGYVTYIVFVLLLLTIFVVWAWEPFDFKNKEKFTICYLCCVGGDADVALQKKEDELSVQTFGASCVHAQSDVTFIGLCIDFWIF